MMQAGCSDPDSGRVAFGSGFWFSAGLDKVMGLCLKIAELQRPLPWSAEDELQQRNVFAQSN